MKSNFQSILYEIKYCLGLSWKTSKFYTFFRIFSKFATPILSIILTYIFKDLLNYLTSNNYNQNNLIKLIAIYFSITVISFFISKIQSYVTILHQTLIENSTMADIMSDALDVDYSVYDNVEFYNHLKSATTDSLIITSIVWNLFDVISVFLTFLITLVVMINLNIYFAILILATSIPSAIIQYKYTKKFYDLELSQVNEERKKNYFFEISTSREYAHDLRLYNLKTFILDKFTKKSNQILIEKKKIIKKRTSSSLIFDLLPEIVGITVQIYVIFLIINNRASIGEFSLYSDIVSQLIVATLASIEGFIGIFDNKLRIDNVMKFKSQVKQISRNGNKILENIQKIEFKNVSFKYPTEQIDAISNISFIINKNDKIALVGKNGSGKSTIIKLLLRYYEVSDGVILINDVNIQDYEILSLRKSFSCYFQNSPNYAFSIKENIAISQLDKKHNNSTIMDYLNLAGIGKKFYKENITIDSYLGKIFSNDGIVLSGGENQKLSLARSFFKESSVIILDEPSSSLDPESEKELFDKILLLSNNKILFFTSHHFSNIKIADKIIVIEDGKLVEMGSKNSLLNNKGRFYEIYSHQIVN